MTRPVPQKLEDRFVRGFKTWCENTSEQLRGRLGIALTDPLPPYQLADYLHIRIWNIGEVPGLNDEIKSYLLTTGHEEWSAITIQTVKVGVIVINSSHSQARQSSSIMHELSHIILNHKPAEMLMDQTGIALRSYNALQEAEADWLGGALLLPRAALVNSFRSMQYAQACDHYGVSNDLYTYRLNVCGVRKQLNKFR
jgi:hypothetical protein